METMVWFGVWFSLIGTSALMAYCLGWGLLRRFAPGHPLSRAAGKIASLPAGFWAVLGVAAFLLPVFALWASAQSYGNTLAGYLPWADATEYYACAQRHLLGVSHSQCTKRPYYAAFFAGILWLTGNKYQLALLLQAAVLGGAVFMFARGLARDAGGPGALAAYAVLFLYAAIFCAGAAMTENAGLLLGVLALTLAWRSAGSPHIVLLCFAILLMAAAQNARPGAMFVLPAFIAWMFFHIGGTFRARAALALSGVAAAAIGIAITSAPAYIAGGIPGEAHSNFSYSLYGLAAGGKGWLYVTIERPEIFSQKLEGVSQTDRVYQAAIESILNRPHLFALGYIKGIASYFDDLFRFAQEFLLLRLAGFYLPWVFGVFTAIQRWREPRYSLLLWLQAGVLVSSPFVIFDGGSRIFAATVALDALFVGLGVMRIFALAPRMARAATARSESMPAGWRTVTAFGALCLALPVAILFLLHAGAPALAYAPPNCENGLIPVVVQPGASTLSLPLVEPGAESIYPLRVRADRFAANMDKTVHSKNELRRAPGTTLLWGIRLDEGQLGASIQFVWPGGDLPPGQPVGFCVEPSGPGKRIGTATSIHHDVSRAGT